MNEKLGNENIHKLLWNLTIPAILGMLSSAVFNVADRIFVGRINPLALSAVGITMPIQILQMAIVLLIGIGSSTLISIRLGEGNKKEAEDILFLSFQYILFSMAIFVIIFFIFLEPILQLLSVSDEVAPYAKPYILIIILGGIIGIPGYCLNNSLRSIGKADITMKAILLTSLLNILLDPLLIFGLNMGIAGAAIATVISQTALTLYIVRYFMMEPSLTIRLKIKKVHPQWPLAKAILQNGSPSFYVQILATALSLYVNHSVVKYGSDMDVAALTIISTIFMFYHMLIYGLVQGNQPICGYNWGSRQYDRVRKSLELSLLYAFLLSLSLFLIVELYPLALTAVFTENEALREITKPGMRIYLMMLPLVGPQTISAQYFQAIEKPRISSILSLLRYGLIMIPCTALLAPNFGITGIYFSNALSDCIAALIAISFIVYEIRKLKCLEVQNLTDKK